MQALSNIRNFNQYWGRVINTIAGEPNLETFNNVAVENLPRIEEVLQHMLTQGDINLNVTYGPPGGGKGAIAHTLRSLNLEVYPKHIRTAVAEYLPANTHTVATGTGGIFVPLVKGKEVADEYCEYVRMQKPLQEFTATGSLVPDLLTNLVVIGHVTQQALREPEVRNFSLDLWPRTMSQHSYRLSLARRLPGLRFSPWQLEGFPPDIVDDINNGEIPKHEVINGAKAAASRIQNHLDSPALNAQSWKPLKGDSVITGAILRSIDLSLVRLQKRAENEGRVDDKEGKIHLKRLATYFTETFPVAVTSGAYMLSTFGGFEEVFRSVIKGIMLRHNPDFDLSDPDLQKFIADGEAVYFKRVGIRK